MTNKDFKTLKTNMYSLQKNINFVSDKLTSVSINGVLYSMCKREGKLTKSQLSEFEYINDFDLDKPISL